MKGIRLLLATGCIGKLELDPNDSNDKKIL